MRIKNKPRFAIFIALVAINLIFAILSPVQENAISGEIYRRGIPIIYMHLAIFEFIVPMALSSRYSVALLQFAVSILLIWVFVYCIFKIPDVLKWIERHLNQIFDMRDGRFRIRIKNKPRFIFFLVLLVINLVLTILFPAREEIVGGYIYRYGITNTFLTIYNIETTNPTPFFGGFLFDTLQFAVNILEMWLLAFLIFKIPAVFRKIRDFFRKPMNA